MAGTLPEGDRGTTTPVALPLGKGDGAVRLRLSTEHRSQARTRIGRTELCGGGPECGDTGSPRSRQDAPGGGVGGQGSGSRLLGAVCDVGNVDDEVGTGQTREP